IADLADKTADPRTARSAAAAAASTTTCTPTTRCAAAAGAAQHGELRIVLVEEYRVGRRLAADSLVHEEDAAILRVGYALDSARSRRHVECFDARVGERRAP